MRLGNLSRLLTALAGPIFVEPQLAMMPGTVDTFISPIRLQASFLVWLDCRGGGLPQRELVSLFVDKAGLALNDGPMFGKGSEGFMRLNVGCPQR